jgi:preprotein translocase subunit SecD
VRFRDTQTLEAARRRSPTSLPDLQTVDVPEGTEYKLTATIKPEAARRVQEQALKQNMVTLHNRINELGVAEPVIQQQGLDRIVVQLPGVQDTAKAKDILGRTATLEVRWWTESTRGPRPPNSARRGAFGAERYMDRERPPVIVRKQVDPDRREPDRRPRPASTPRRQEAAVHLTLDAQGRAHLPRRDARERRQAHGHPAVREGQGRGS